MDRTTELKTDYEQMQELVSRFQQRLTLKVAPNNNHRWYLFEKEGRESWVEQYDPQMAEYMKSHWGVKGWTVTPIDIFRTS